MKKFIGLLLAFYLLTFLFGANQPDFPDIYIDESVASGGVGSLADPYSDFSEINWTTGGDNSIFDHYAGAEDASVTINLKAGEEWREQLDVEESGSATYPIIIRAYGEGADPIINGSVLIAPGSSWTETSTPIQDIDTDYTEVDEAGELSANDTRATMTALNSRDVNSYFYRDMTLNYFSGDFRFFFDCEFSAVDQYAIVELVSVADALGNSKAIEDGTDNLLGAEVYGGASNPQLRLTEIEGGASESSSVYNISVDTLYYCDFYRDDDAGANGTIYLDVYGSASNRASQASALANLSLALDSQVDYRYAYITQSYDSGSADRDATGYVENVQFVTGLTLISNVWEATSYEPNQIYLDGTRGVPVGSIVLCNSANKWYWNSNLLYIYSEPDPDTAYQSPGVEAIRRNGVEIVTQNYITVDGLDVKYCNFGIIPIDGGGNHIIQYNTVQYCDEFGIRYADVDFACDSVLVQYNTCHHNGAGGIGALHYSTNWIIQYNTCHHNAGTAFESGILIYWTTSTGNIIQYNTVHDGGRHGIWVDWAGAGNIVRYNSVTTTFGFGIFIERTSNTEVYYNLIYGTNDTGIEVKGGTSAPAANDNLIYNNVCYDNAIGIRMRGTTGEEDMISDNLVKNNICLGNAQMEFAATYGGENDGTMGSGNVYENNCFGAESSDFIEWGSGVKKDTYDDWETAYGGTTSSVESDPLMIDAANDDFRLLMASPCVNAGVDVGLTTDYRGRSIRHAPDIGAYEDPTNVLFMTRLFNYLKERK